MKKILDTIINFFKMIFVYIVNFFLSFFPDRKKKEIKKDIIKEEIPTKHETKSTYFETPTSNRDEDNTSILKPLEEIIEEEITYSEKQLLLINLINKTIDDIIEKKENIKIRDLDLETEKELNKIKEKITPLIIKDIDKEYIKTEYVLKKELTKALELEFEKHPIFPPKENKEENELSNNVLPNDKEITSPHLELKDEITNLITSSTLIIASVTKELLTPSKNEKKAEIKREEPIIQDIIKDIPSIEEETNKKEVFLDDTKKTSTPSTNSENITKEKEEPTITKEAEEAIPTINEKEEAKIKEEKEEIKEVTITPESIDPVPKEEHQKINLINLTPIEESTKQIIDFTNEDCKKKELEEKNYEPIEEEIDKMLNQITNFLLKYENKLTKEQKQQLNAELERLRNTKEKMLTQKENDIKNEENNLNQFITNDEINSLRYELNKLDIEQQIDLNNEKIKKVEELEYIEKKEAAKIEKKILKKRLKKSSRLLALTSLLSLPFVRNKYFFYFTVGSLVNYNLRLIDSLIHHKSINKEPQLPELKKGKDALYEAINSTNENIIYLNNLEQEILMMHPDLSEDNEYLLYIRSLKDRLNKTEEKLRIKQEVLDKYCHKNLRYKKILRKTK